MLGAAGGKGEGGQAHAINGGSLPVVPTRRFDPAVGDIVETNDDHTDDHHAQGTPLAMPFGGHGEVTYETQTWDGADCVWRLGLLREPKGPLLVRGARRLRQPRRADRRAPASPGQGHL